MVLLPAAAALVEEYHLDEQAQEAYVLLRDYRAQAILLALELQPGQVTHGLPMVQVTVGQQHGLLQEGLQEHPGSPGQAAADLRKCRDQVQTADHLYPDLLILPGVLRADLVEEVQVAV